MANYEKDFNQINSFSNPVFDVNDVNISIF
jgi:hypothetical protein